MDEFDRKMKTIEMWDKTQDLRALKSMYENIGAKEKAKEIQKQIDKIERQ